MSSIRQVQHPCRLHLIAFAIGITWLNSIPCLAMDAGDPTSTSSIPPDIAKLDTVEVTGSRLKRVDIEGALPVAIITREQIDQTGEISVAAFLRNQIDNSFGSFTPLSGTGTAQGGAQVNLRGLGAERTLVLMDGRRMPNNPAFGGASPNINNIPLALVERIEILREGASAIYGSDAIGGVINIITKSDHTGMQFSSQVDRPHNGKGDAVKAALAGGLTNDKGRLYFALEHYNKDIVYGRNVDAIRVLSTTPSYPGTIYQYDPNGNVVPQNSNLDASGNPRNFRPFDNCPTTGFDSNPDYPHSNVVDGRCRYNTGAVVALTADVARQNLTLGGDYRLSHQMTGFARIMMANANTFGRFPAAAVDTSIAGINAPDVNGNLGIRIEPDNPNNPNPGSTLVLNYRTTVLGPRDYEVEEHVSQFLFGIKGTIDFLGFKRWELASNYDAYKQKGRGSNYGLINQLQAAVDAGRFNPFAPDATVADEFRYTTTSDNHFIAKGVDGKLDYEMKLASLNIPFVFGFEYRKDDFGVISDAQSTQAVFFGADGSVNGFRQSNVFGSIGGSARGARSYAAAFMEAVITLDDNKLELGYALRLDDYSDVGNALSQKWSARYQPADHLLLRASLSEGFRAPDLASMHGSPSKAQAYIVDSLACRENAEDPDACRTNPTTAIFDSNPQLAPERSRNFSAGLVWSAGSRLSLTVDYYSIRVKHAITQLGPQTVFDNELRCVDAGRKCDARQEGYVVRTAANGLLFSYSPAINAAKLETNGWNLGASYPFDSNIYGRYTASANLARTLSFKRQDAQDRPLLERIDTLNGNGEIFPKLRANTMLNWKLGVLDSTLAVNYISKVTDCDAPDKVAGSPACRNKFGDYLTIDLQLGVKTPWHQRIAIGARNLFNQEPRVSRYVKSAAIPGTFYRLHDSDQRVLYLRFTQDF